MYCYDCMNKIKEGNFCPFCNKENTPSAVTHHLKAGTLLEGKYLVGNSVAENEVSITYIGCDTETDARLKIVEFFPVASVTRDRNTSGNEIVAINEEHKRNFIRGKEAFIKEAGKQSVSSGGFDVLSILEENNTEYIIMNDSENTERISEAGKAVAAAGANCKENQEESVQQSNTLPHNKTSVNQPSRQTKPKKKKSGFAIGIVALIIAALAAVAVVVIIMLIVLAIFLFNLNGDISNKEVSNSASTYERYEETAGGVVEEREEYRMYSYEGTHYYDAKEYLESLGLEVVIEFEYSDTVEKYIVISQSVPEGEYVTEGDTVTLYVSDGVEQSPYGYNQKVVVSASANSSNGKLYLYEWKDGDWKEQFSCTATVGSKGISSNYGENSTATPKGTFKLGVVLSDNYVQTGMSVYYVDSNTCIVDDSSSEYYNVICDSDTLPSDTHYEDVGDILTDGDCNALIFIEHNGDGYSSEDVVAGKGSAITICGVNGKLGKTGGCIDITAEDMTTLLSLLDEESNPHIEIKTN